MPAFWASIGAPAMDPLQSAATIRFLPVPFDREVEL